MVIFINHMPDNPWFWYTPSRFGLSDAAEVFVFLSGFACALAYGRCFQRAGLWLGLIRVLHRCLQIYSAHLASFVVLALICVIGNRWVPEMDDIQRLNISYFFDATQQALYDLFTLAYIPNYFDILPMYLVMMVWLPIFWVLSRVHVVAALGCSAALYWVALYYGWELTADPASGRFWYFNPFNWQWMFFTGYAFGAGWIPINVRHSWLTLLSLGLVLLSIPLGHEPTYRQLIFWGELRTSLEPWLDKSHLGLLRWAHLLALAYLVHRLGNWRPHWLSCALPRAIVIMGQQSLPIFLCSMMLSYAGGIWLDHLGRDAWMKVALVNVSGLGLMLIAGQVMAWLDAKPWKVATVNHATQQDCTYDAELPVGHYRWGSQLIALPLLIGLAIVPAWFMNHQSDSGDSPSDLVVQASPVEDFQPVEAVLPNNDERIIDTVQPL